MEGLGKGGLEGGLLEGGKDDSCGLGNCKRINMGVSYGG